MSSYKLLTVQASGKEKRLDSATLTMDFTSVRIGADALAIAQGGSGGSAYLDVGARALRSTFVPANDADLVNLLALNNAISALQAGVSWQDAVSTRADAPTGVEATGTRVLIIEEGNLAITAISAGVGGTFTVAGDQTQYVGAGDIIKIKGSTNNDGYFTVATSTFDSTDTNIVVVETVGAVADGTIHYAGATYANEAIAAVVTGAAGTFSIVGDVTSNYTAGDRIQVIGSTGNDGWYTVTSATFSDPNTDIVVVESIPDATVDGDVYYKTSQEFRDLGVDKIAVKGASSWTAGSAPVAGWATLVNDDTGKMYIYGVSSWAPSYFEATTASNGLKKVGFDIQRDDTDLLTNDNASPVTTRQVVYIKSNGNVDLAVASNGALVDSNLGLVYDTSIASAATGAITVRQGALIPGFTGLTPGKEYFVDNSTPGLINLYSAITWVATDQVVRVGRAISATELIFDPEYNYEY